MLIKLTKLRSEKIKCSQFFLFLKSSLFLCRENSFAVIIYNIGLSKSFCINTQVEVARPKWPLIRRVSSAHMFPVRSNYMVWKRLRAHFCLDNGLELAWSEATLFWDGLIRGHFVLGRSDQRQFQAHTSLIRGWFERTLVWPETNSSDIFFQFCFVFLLTFVVSGKRQQ